MNIAFAIALCLKEGMCGTACKCLGSMQYGLGSSQKKNLENSKSHNLCAVEIQGGIDENALSPVRT